ncbi:MAG: nitronate monooxygenase family protein [Bacteroidota bacterium]
MALPSSLTNRLRLPVVAAPMFLISGPEMVIAACKSGILGSFPALNHRTTEGFDQWCTGIEEALGDDPNAAPYGVNLIVHRSNPRLQADLEVCIKHKVPVIITSLGAVPELIEAVHSYGGLVFHDVTNRRHAAKAAAAGVDGLIAVCAGAGGHAGEVNPLALVAEIREFFDKTLLLSGCISSGSDVAAALQMGADLAYMGTRFINVKESQAPEEYQQMIIDCGTKDIVYSAAVSGVPANFMWPSLAEAGFTKEMLKETAEIDFGKELTPPKEGAKAWKTIWSAGQGCVAVKDVPTMAELTDRLSEEFRAAILRQQQLLQTYA